jgi:alkylation response protein AidB-like acyl-CoA dehydrogenase
MNHSKASHWIEVAHSLGEEFAGRAEAHDEDDTFVSRNYAALKERRVFSAAIAEELGGGGASHHEVSDMLRHSPNTAALRRWRCRCISMSSPPRFGSPGAARAARRC